MAHDFTGITVGDLETLQPNQNTMVLTETSPNVYESLGMGGVSTGVSVGTFFWFCGSNIPAFALECDGSAISRTTYAALFNIISTTFGVGDGSTTFNLPDLTTANRFIRAADGTTISLGDEQADGAPNITGDFVAVGDNAVAGNGAFATTQLSANVAGSASGYDRMRMNLDASTFDATYSDSVDEIRPVNIALTPCIAWREFQTGSINSYPSLGETMADDDAFLIFDDSAGINKKVTQTDAQICRIATGSYTGDGTTSQAITGVGFQPTHLWITHNAGDGGSPVKITTNDALMALDAQGLAHQLTPAPGVLMLDNRVLSFGADGFTVSDDGSDSHPNTSGTTYLFTAWG